MRFADAKKLHNDDEVILKETGEILTVLNAFETKNDFTKKTEITIEAIGTQSGYLTVTHQEVK